MSWGGWGPSETAAKCFGPKSGGFEDGDETRISDRIRKKTVNV